MELDHPQLVLLVLPLPENEFVEVIIWWKQCLRNNTLNHKGSDKDKRLEFILPPRLWQQKVFGDFTMNFRTKNLFRLPDLLNIKNRLSTFWAAPFSQIVQASLIPLLKSPLIKNVPVFNILIILFSFNNAAIFCINICVLILINQYSTGLFVYSIKS